MSDAEHHERTGLEVAIIGLAGRFPGADDVRQFWHNLRSGEFPVWRKPRVNFMIALSASQSPLGELRLGGAETAQSGVGEHIRYRR